MDDGRAARGQKIIYFPAQSKGTIMTEMPKFNISNIIHTMLSFNGTFFAHFFPSLLRSLSGSVRGTPKPPLPIPRHTRVLRISHVHAISNRIKPRHFNSSNVLTPRRSKTRRESRGGKGEEWWPRVTCSEGTQTIISIIIISHQHKLPSRRARIKL